jgi:hypothetical protein
MIETDVDNLGILIEDTSRAIEVRLDEEEKPERLWRAKRDGGRAKALLALEADRKVLNEDAADAGNGS